MKQDTILHVYIGDDDIQVWTQGIGKETLMPVMFECCKRMISENIDKLQFARVEATVRGNKKAFDFFVEIEGVWDTLSKLMQWAIEEERYEMCSEIKKLEKQLEDENTF
jgi:hypothetical protein|tara:strand:- start:2304 stop:2630 length:327 start_codon:yes stop_codon:yes gene_type:complete